jgi:hypothetical protein
MTAEFNISPTKEQAGKVLVPAEVLRELDAHPTAISDLALLWNAGETGRRLALEIADQFNSRRIK